MPPGGQPGAPPGSAPSWPGDEAALLRAFDVQPGASNWRARASGGYTVARLEANPNIAVGITPWGPFASEGFTTQPVLLITSEQSALPHFRPTDRYSSLGATFTSILLRERLLTGCAPNMSDVLVVDMGWPSADRRYADVATFGASRLMGECC